MENILNLDDSEFINSVVYNNVNMSEEVINRFLNLPVSKVIKFYSLLSDDKILEIFKCQHLINETNFANIFLRVNNNLKKNILESDYYFKLFLTYSNRFSKSLLNFVSHDMKLDILKNKKRIDSIDKTLYKNILSSLSEEELNTFSSILENNSLFDSEEELRNYLNLNYNVSKDIIENFIIKTNQKSRSSLLLLKVNSSSELLFYNKFNITIKVEEEEDNFRFSNGVIVKKEFINNINEKHMVMLIQTLKAKENSKNITETFLTSLYLYSFFGYANSLSIINDKYTYINNLSLNKAAMEDFIDNRRQYRLENQDRFYSYDLVLRAEKALKANNYKFFKDLSGEEDEEIYKSYLDSLKINIDVLSKSNEDGNNIDYKEEIKSLLQFIIQEREKKHKKNYINKYCEIFLNNKQNRGPVSILELYNLLGNVDLNKVSLDKSGRPIINDRLQSFLLGNLKKDNDCLLRLVLNKLALGLNTTIDDVINDFSKIEDIIQNSGGKLSMHSMLDVIDVCKTLLYELKPNEQDITLDSVAMILKSEKHCTESGEELFLRARELHKKRREKVKATIPSVFGNTVDDIKYKVMNFDDPSLITCGIETGSCFKVGGKAEPFLEYCLTSPHAVIVGMWDENKDFYLCPFIRNGNGIYGNGIDPEPKDDKKKKKLLLALEECTKKIIKASEEDEKIEFATITDLNQKEFFLEKDYPKMPINDILSIGCEFYSDYYKEEITSYVISSINDKVTPRLYEPQKKFYQKRIPNYEYKVDTESDKERIQLFVNSINYSNIDCINNTDEYKNSLRRQYKEICVEDYEYIIGNKDWFIAIGRCMNIVTGLLPYDERARLEYFHAVSDIKKMDKFNIMEENKRK